LGGARYGFLEHVHEARLNFSKLFSQTMHQHIECPQAFRPERPSDREIRAVHACMSGPHRKCGQTDKKRGKDKKIKGSNGFGLAEQ
jgi:hypothetical protein